MRTTKDIRPKVVFCLAELLLKHGAVPSGDEARCDLFTHKKIESFFVPKRLRENFSRFAEYVTIILIMKAVVDNNHNNGSSSTCDDQTSTATTTTMAGK